MPLSNPSFDNRLTTTIALWVQNNLNDVFSSHIPFLYRLKEKGNMKFGGGHGGRFVEPLMFPKSGNPAPVGIANATAAYTNLTFVETTNITSASYEVAEILLPISIQEYDLDAQGSETQKVDLMQSVMDSNMTGLTEYLNRLLWENEDVVGSVGSRASLLSIKSLINGGGATTTGGAIPAALPEQTGARGVVSTAGAVAQFTVGNINRNATEAAYWASPIFNTAQALSIQTLSALVTRATRGKDTPDLIILPLQLYDKLMGLLTNGGNSGGQMYGQSKMVEAGFEAIRFRNCDVIFDDGVPITSYTSGSTTALGMNVFCLNTKYIKLRAKSMKPTIKETPDSRAIRTWTARWLGQITSGNTGRVHSRHVNMS